MVPFLTIPTIYVHIHTQIIREIVLIEETASREAEEGEGDEEEDGEFNYDDEDDDGDDIGSDDDDDEEEGEKGGGKGKKNAKEIIDSATRLAGLTVPEGGYGEEEDCVNADDEQYRSVYIWCMYTYIHTYTLTLFTCVYMCACLLLYTFHTY